MIPSDEQDGDGDLYIECTYDSSTWQGSSTIVGGDDCDDALTSVHPGADELCSTSMDDDCDGTINEDDAVDATTWYQDTDSDGFGDLASTALACTVPTGYISNSEDCDDTLATINPAAEDIVGNGIDEDCSGSDALGQFSQAQDPKWPK